MTYDVRFSDGSIGYGLTDDNLDYWDSIGEIYTIIATHPSGATGIITNVEMQIGSEYYRSSSGQLPALIPIDNQTFEVHIKFKSTTQFNASALCTIYLRDPNGVTYEIPYWHRVGLAPGEELTWNFSPPEAVNSIPGMWMLAVEFDVDGTIVAAWGWDNIISANPGELEAYLEKWVNKVPEGTMLSMPASVSSTGNAFEIGIKYKNTSSVGYNARPVVIATGPGTNQVITGTPIRNYTWINPGEEVSYTFNIGAVDVAGAWTCSIKILTDSGMVAAEYMGPCLTVRGDTVGDSGVITDMYFNYDNNLRVPFGATIPADSHNLEIGVKYQNTSPGNVVMGILCEVWSPSGLKQVSPSIDWATLGPNLPTPYLKTYQFGKINEVGNWKVRVKLLKQDMTVMDTWPESGESGLLLVAYDPDVTPPPDNTEEEDNKSTFPWASVIIGGAAVLAIVIASKSTSKNAINIGKKFFKR